MDVAFQLVGGAAFELKRVVVNVGVGEFDQGDGAGDATVIPPVGLDGGNAVDGALVIDGGDDEVVSIFHDTGDLAVERREAAFVIADMLVIDEDVSGVIDRAEVDEEVRVRLRVVLEVALIPEQAFEVEERIFLGVPVAGNVEGGRSGEVILNERTAGDVVRIFRVAVQAGVVGVRSPAFTVRVGDVVPGSVETGLCAVVDVDEQRGLLGVGGDGEECEGGKQSKAERRTAAHGDHLIPCVV